MTQFADWFAPSLLRTSLSLIVAALLVATCVKWLRLRSPDSEQWAWLLVLTQGVMFVWLTVPVPEELLPAFQNAAAPLQDALPTLSAPPVAPTSDPAPDLDTAPQTPLHPRRTIEEWTAPETEIALADAPPVAPAVSLREHWRHWPQAVAALWLAGLVTVIATGAARYAGYVRRLGTARPAPADWTHDWHALCAAAGLARPLPLVVAKNLGPALCRLPAGYLLVVPEDTWASLSPANRRAIFRHELEHYRRGDLWRLLCVRLLASVHWFNPCAWWAARRYEAQSEFACDLAAAGGDPAAFSELLVQLAAGNSRRITGVQAVAAGSVYERVQRLLKSEPRRSTSSAAIPALVAGVAILAAGVRVQAVASAPTTVETPETAPARQQEPDNTSTSAIAAAPDQRNDQTDSSDSVHRDAAGDPLPPGALVRLGTARLRQNEQVEGLAFMPDGRQLASSSWEDTIRFWDVETGALARRIQLPGHDDYLGLTFSSDGKRMAAVSTQGHVLVWDLVRDELVFDVVGHKQNEFGCRVYGAAFSPDNVLLATGGDDETVALWDVATGDLRRRFSLGEWRGNRDECPVLFSPDGSSLVAASSGGTVFVWNVETGAEIREIKTGVRTPTLALLDGGRQLISYGRQDSVSEDGQTRKIEAFCIWNIADGKLVTRFGGDHPFRGDYGFAVTPDESTLVSVHFEGMCVWDLKTKTVVRTLASGGRQYGGRTHGIAMSPDGRLVSVKAFDNKVRLWEIATGQELLPQEGFHRDSVISVQFTPDGTSVATGGADAVVRLWNAQTGAQLRVLATMPANGWFKFVDFLQDGRFAVVGGETHAPGKSFAGLVQVVRTADGQIEDDWSTIFRLTCGAVSPDGRRIAAASGEEDDFPRPPENVASIYSIQVWDAQTFEDIGDLRGHTGRTDQLAFTSDGRDLWSFSSRDQTLRRWSIDDEAEVLQVNLKSTGERDVWNHVQFSRDASQFALIGSRDFERPSAVPGHTEYYSHSLIAGWNVGSDAPTWLIEVENEYPWGIPPVYSPDGRWLAHFMVSRQTERDQKRIVLRSAADGKERASLPIDDGSVRSLAFSPDGRRLAAGMNAGDALIFDVSHAAAPSP